MRSSAPRDMNELGEQRRRVLVEGKGARDGRREEASRCECCAGYWKYLRVVEQGPFRTVLLL